MKATILVLLAFLLATATVHAAQEAHPITIDLEDASLVDALDQVQKASGIRLAYSQELVADAKRVTLKADNEPVDEVLRRILRPRGLEIIYTGKNVAAIVRADSDVGMAKAAGRALRTFVRLVKKLEGAEQHGDEVKVPGWTDADDRALAEAYVDLMGAGSCFAMTGEYSGGEASLWIDKAERAMKTYDQDVRVGVALKLGIGALALDGQTVPRADAERFLKAATGMMKDADPIMRTCGLLLTALTSLVLVDGDWQPLVMKAVADGKKDPALEVRLATVFVCVGGEIGPSILEELRSDDSAIVRFASRASWLGNNKRHADPVLMREIVAGLLEDKNPIVRPVGLFSLYDMHGRDVTKVHEALKMVDLGKDPWLKLSVDTLLPLMEACLLYTSPSPRDRS